MPTGASAAKPGRMWQIRLLAVFAGACLIWIGLDTSSVAIYGPGYTFPGHVFRAALTFALVLLLLALLLKWEHAAAREYGLLPGRHTPLNLGLGAVGYLLPLTVAAAAILSLNLAALHVPGTPGEAVGQLAAVLVLVLLYEAVPEELIFRGYLFTLLKQHAPIWAVVPGQAVLFCLFGFAVGAARTPDRLLLFLIFSLGLGVIRAATSSVYVTIGFHAAFQAATQPVLMPHWTAITLDDPERWFSDLAFGLCPLVLGPPLVILVTRLVRRRSREPGAGPQRSGGPGRWAGRVRGGWRV